jgi:hypothetical protein
MGHHPPYKSSGGAYYAVVRADADELDVYKATDPTSSWTIQDSADGPVHAGTLLGFSTVQDGDVIHMIAWSSAAYEYYTFNMATDQWVVDQAIESSIDADQPWGSIAVRSDGDVVVVYAGATDLNMGDSKERIDFNVRVSGSWGGPTALDDGGDVHYGNPVVVKGPLTDDMHITYQETNETANDPPTSWITGSVRTLRPDDTLSIRKTFDWSVITLLPVPNMVTYEDSGTQRIAWGYGWNDSSIKVARSTEDGSDDIQAPFAAGPINFPRFSGEMAIFTFAELDGDLYMLYSGGGTSGVDQDLYYSKSTNDGATWSTVTEEIDAITVNYISANIYVRGTDTVMAYVYDDAGVVKYNEKVLVAGAPFLTIGGTITTNRSPAGSFESQVVGSPELTITLTLAGTTWITVGGSPNFNDKRQAIIDGLDSAQIEKLGWNNEIRDKLNVANVVRTSDTVVTITLDATDVASYKIVADETIIFTLPIEAIVAVSPEPTVSPTIVITAECDEVLAPDTLLTQQNLSGAVTDIDERVVSPEGSDWLIFTPP